MAVELGASRLLAPYFSSSQIVWTIIIGTIMIALAIGNVVGSNMFNILAVIGIATVIAPMNNVPLEVLQRDWIVMLVLTIALLIMAYGFKNKEGKITRLEGTILVVCYVAYNTYLGLNLTGNL